MVINGDALTVLAGMTAESVQCVVTSPPYWGLRDYGVSGQLGLEATPDEYVSKMVTVFREVRRVLRKDGVLWLNLGDSYGTGTTAGRPSEGTRGFGERVMSAQNAVPRVGQQAKQLIGIPWRVAFALQADGWWLRSDIIWSKPNPMPESVTDRPTKAHEYIFLLTKAERYFYDAAAIREPYSAETKALSFATMDFGRRDKYAAGPSRPARLTDKQRGHGRRHEGFNDRWDAMSKDEQQSGGANKRSVWSVATCPYPDAHFATFPEDLVKPCVLAGSRAGDTVLDPFAGSGTVGVVAKSFMREFVGIDLNPDYCAMAERRIDAQNPALLAV